MQALLKPGRTFYGAAVSMASVAALLAVLVAPAFADLSSGPAYEGARPRLPEPQRPPEQRPPRPRPPLEVTPPPREHEVNRRDEWRRDEWRRREREERREDWRRRQMTPPPLWYGDIRFFDRQDLPRWRNGYWRFTWHNGELAWWWIVGRLWYPYVEPVYPYPDPYLPYNPSVVIESRPALPDPYNFVPAEPPAPMWYYCESAGAYYPYVATCREGWRAVPANPPVTAPVR